jgi:HD-GYP domain-containing protein (c-di-GMP phosphodiesterase class II)
MYSAITEERPYHKASTKEQALEIIYEEVKKGVICREVFEALRKST